MIHRAYISDAGNETGEAIAVYLLQRGLRVAAQFPDAGRAEQFQAAIPEYWQGQLLPLFPEQPGEPGSDEAGVLAPELEQAQRAAAAAAEALGGLELYIHGPSWLDEHAMLEQAPEDLAANVEQRLKSLFVHTRAAAALMGRKRAGRIVVPLLADSLYYSGYGSSPIYNQGAISYIRSLAKELSPLRVTAHTLMIGYHQGSEAARQAAGARRPYEIYALKPAVPALQQAVAGLGLLLDYGDGLSGHSIDWGNGMEASI